MRATHLRPFLLAVLFGLTVAAAPVLDAQQTTPPPTPTPQQPTPAPAAPADPFVFDADAAFIFLSVAPEAVADFEAMMAKVKESLGKIDKPERKTQAASWKVIKADAQQNGLTMFIFMLDPVSRGVSYNPWTIMTEAAVPPADVKAFYDKVAPNIKGINMLSYKPLISMSGS
jgi:hypothetical protein